MLDFSAFLTGYNVALTVPGVDLAVTTGVSLADALAQTRRLQQQNAALQRQLAAPRPGSDTRNIQLAFGRPQDAQGSSHLFLTGKTSQQSQFESAAAGHLRFRIKSSVWHWTALMDCVA